MNFLQLYFRNTGDDSLLVLSRENFEKIKSSIDNLNRSSRLLIYSRVGNKYVMFIEESYNEEEFNKFKFFVFLSVGFNITLSKSTHNIEHINSILKTLNYQII